MSIVLSKFAESFVNERLTADTVSYKHLTLPTICSV